jgi:hypothetical protein
MFLSHFMMTRISRSTPYLPGTTFPARASYRPQLETLEARLQPGQTGLSGLIGSLFLEAGLSVWDTSPLSTSGDIYPTTAISAAPQQQRVSPPVVWDAAVSVTIAPAAHQDGETGLTLKASTGSHSGLGEMVINPALELAVNTIDQGFISYHRYGDPHFAGMDRVIMDQSSWNQFWFQHVEGILPPQKMPAIDFSTTMVVVDLMGYQSTLGPFTTIQAVEYNAQDNGLYVSIQDDRTPGMLQIVTNPYHLASVPRVEFTSITFEHSSKGT